MARVSREIDKERIARLKKMLYNNRYVDAAVNYIAQQLTNRLFDKYN